MNTSRVAVIERLDHALSAAKTPLQRFERAVTPWVTFAIMPVFALFNAGVHVDVMAAANLATPVPLGIILGLVIGKQVGVFAAAWLAVKTGLASLPDQVTWRQMYGTAWLAGIGFTMSLFIGGLAFAGTPTADQAKLGILVGSFVAGAGGILLLLTAPSRPSHSDA
jgi:NhaA family Na+:H+ antiporter